MHPVCHARQRIQPRSCRACWMLRARVFRVLHAALVGLSRSVHSLLRVRAHPRAGSECRVRREPRKPIGPTNAERCYRVRTLHTACRRLGPSESPAHAACRAFTFGCVPPLRDVRCAASCRMHGVGVTDAGANVCEQAVCVSVRPRPPGVRGAGGCTGLLHGGSTAGGVAMCLQGRALDGACCSLLFWCCMPCGVACVL